MIHGRKMSMTNGPSSRGEMRVETIAVIIPRFQAHRFWLLNPYADVNQTRTKGVGRKMK